MAVKIKSKIWKTGNGYVITVPKNLVESGNFTLGEEVVAQLEPFQLNNGRSWTWTSDIGVLSSAASGLGHRPISAGVSA